MTSARLGAAHMAMKEYDFFEVAEALTDCRSQEDIHEICLSLSRALEFEHFVFGAYFPLLDNIVIINGFPLAWRQYYDDAGYINVDPTVKHCSRNTSPVTWDALKIPRGTRGDAARKMMAEASSYGLNSGVSLPVHGAGAEWGMFSLAAKRTAPPELGNQIFGLQCVALAVHEAVKRVVACETDAVIAETQLTARERECLQWTANGKTAWEISRILNLSESTVTFHLKNAIAKMEVTNRPHAVAKALAQSRITLF